MTKEKIISLCILLLVLLIIIYDIFKSNQRYEDINSDPLCTFAKIVKIGPSENTFIVNYEFEFNNKVFSGQGDVIEGLGIYNRSKVYVKFKRTDPSLSFLVEKCNDDSQPIINYECNCE